MVNQFEKQSVDNKVVTTISDNIQKEFRFIPIFTIISIVLSTIQLLWKCFKPANAQDGQKALMANFDGNNYSRRAVVSTKREVLKSARRQNLRLTNEQAEDIAIRILDGMREAPAEVLPDFELI